MRVRVSKEERGSGFGVVKERGVFSWREATRGIHVSKIIIKQWRVMCKKVCVWVWFWNLCGIIQVDSSWAWRRSEGGCCCWSSGGEGRRRRRRGMWKRALWCESVSFWMLALVCWLLMEMSGDWRVSAFSPNIYPKQQISVWNIMVQNGKLEFHQKTKKKMGNEKWNSDTTIIRSKTTEYDMGCLWGWHVYRLACSFCSVFLSFCCLLLYHLNFFRRGCF